MVVLISTYSSIGFIIGNDDFIKLKAKIPNYFGWQAVVKELLYPNKVEFNENNKPKNPKKITYYKISSDGKNTFKLSKNNQLYINSLDDTSNEKLIVITAVTKQNKTKCFRSKFKANIIINIKKFNKKCENAIYFIGKIEDQGYQTVSFFFGLSSERQGSKNLMVISATNFYNYTSNQYKKNLYNSESNFYGNLNDFPSSIDTPPHWVNETNELIWSISELLPDFDLIMDYELENISLEKYKSIIFPIHQEYISKNIMNKLITFLNETKNSKIFIAGGSVFQREVIFDLRDEMVQIVYLKEKGTPGTYINQSKYGINPRERTINDPDRGCVFVDKEDLSLSETAIPSSINVEGHFNKIKCVDNSEIPLLTTTKYNNNGTLIHILSDGIALNFTGIPYLKKKITNLLRN